MRFALSSVAATCALGARQHLPGLMQASGQMSAASVVDAIGSLLQEQDSQASLEVIQRVSSNTDSQESPVAEDAMEQSLKVIINNIKQDVEAKIKAAQTKTQAKINEKWAELKKTNAATASYKANADSSDKTYFDCVVLEQSSRSSADSAEEKMASSRSNENEACQLKQDNKDFSYDTDEKTIDYTCDISKAGNCDAELSAYTAKLKKIQQEVKDALALEQAKYKKHEASCAARVKERVVAQSAQDSEESSWASQRQQCEDLSENRNGGICDYGKLRQLECAAGNSFKAFITSTMKTQGDHHSEPDRKGEWQTAGATKCMVEKAIATGLSKPLDAADLQACAAQVNYDADVGQLDRKEKDFAAISGACETGAASFNNGQAWNVPSGPKPKASEYTRAAYTQEISMQGLPCEFCGAYSAPSIQGATLHNIENGDCGATVNAASIRSVDDIDKATYHVGASVNSWGCDRLKKLGALVLVQKGSKQYVVSRC